MKAKTMKPEEELKRLKDDIKKNISVNYQQGELEPESITYYGVKFMRQKP